ncbi:MAG TPA: acetyl-CoA carboxylase biotin carboxyl carrier protein [Chloroflexota bacterium]
MPSADLPLPLFLNELLPGVLKVFDSSTLSELELHYGDVHLSLRRPMAVAGSGAVVTAAAVPALAAPPTEPEGHAVTAQMVGTFYLAPAPGKPPLVQEGDFVEKGQVIGIIEAMKVMNELEADVGGRVVRILVKNQEPVEYGQPLMLIAPE